MIIEDAVYREHNLEEFIGNPLIAALPHMISPNEYPKNLIVLPPYKQSDRLKSPSDRLLALKRLEQLHIPTVQDSMILMSITRCLLWGYASRNPLDFNVVKSLLVSGVQVFQQF